jgi:hypothetical protein
MRAFLRAVCQLPRYLVFHLLTQVSCLSDCHSADCPFFSAVKFFSQSGGYRGDRDGERDNGYRGDRGSYRGRGGDRGDRPRGGDRGGARRDGPPRSGGDREYRGVNVIKRFSAFVLGEIVNLPKHRSGSVFTTH